MLIGHRYSKDFFQISHDEGRKYMYRFFPFRIGKTPPDTTMQPVPADYPVERLSGPEVVAYLLHWGLFGTLTVQLYLYYLAFPKDRIFIKYLVYGVYIAEFIQTMLLTHDAFASFGYGFGDLETLTEVRFGWLTVPIMGAAAACVGHAFYAYRIFILSKSRIVPAFVIFVSLTSFVAAIITGVDSFQAGDITELNDRKTSLSIGITCGGVALCDIVIAVYMAYYLLRSNTGFHRTQILVTKLIRLTIETGSLTAVVALATLILFFAFPHQTFYATPALVVSKMYANTIYMVLNSRIRIIGGRDIYMSSTDMGLTTTVMEDITPHPMQGTQTLVVAITKEVFTSDHQMDQMSRNHRTAV
ncbi:hypothetical protein ARMSODRAFT_946100 [Armillaria solidipes]|uniref:DUF6534 domain-containing protein n=1 Tax=Armillaria solidipes TaxID=1076256 RepID=A0A2H3B4P4_9AGAR|nr:hypothetical protein ARMSODRAFT_946100 [Armillaria solidipes]